MNILVTGGVGYVGSHTVAALLSLGHAVVIVDRVPVDPRGPLSGAVASVADVADTAMLERLLVEHRIDGVIHFAALKSVAESMGDPAIYFRNNVAGSLSVLEAMLRASVTNIVFSSSCSVYGTPEAPPVSESAPLRPESPYGASKVMVEDMLRWFDAVSAVRYMSLRYFNAAGASTDARLGEDWDQSTMLIPALLKAALGRRGPVDIYGTDYPTPDGTAIRDFVHVVDLAEAHVRALTHLATNGRSDVLNLGTGHGSSVREVIDTVRQITNHEVPVRFVGRREGDPPAVWADPTKARVLLGWKAEHGLPGIVRSAWAWHSSDG